MDPKKKYSIMPPNDLLDSVGFNPNYTTLVIKSLRKIMQSLDTHSQRLLKQYEMSVPQVMCLYELFEKGTMTVAVLANEIHLSASTTVGVIDRLEEKKLVKRTRDSVDRRSVFVNITAKGHEFVTNTPHLLHNRLHDSLHKLDENEQIVIATALQTLVQMLEEK